MKLCFRSSFRYLGIGVWGCNGAVVDRGRSLWNVKGDQGRGESSDCNFRLPTKDILPADNMKSREEVVKSMK
jgi:hypothetical protein